MIKFKHLINEVHNVETLKAKDIFNFYYLWHTALHSPESVQTPFGKEVLNYYLSQFKAKYVRLFSKVLAKQIQKYVERKRVDPDFPVTQNIEGQSPEALLALMKKTLRSDMKRRNDKWEMVGEFVSNLSKASSPKDIFLWVNQLNNAVHNTGMKVMDKFPNFHTELNRAFDTVHKANNVEALKAHVDKDIRDLKDQEGPSSPEDYGQNDLQEGLEKIVMSPDALAKLNAPDAPPQIHRPPNVPPLKPKAKSEDEKDVPPELKLGPLQEDDSSVDAALYGMKKIPANRPPDKYDPPKLKMKKPEDDEDPKKKTDHFKLGALQEALNTAEIPKEDRENVSFMTGLKFGVQDKSNNRTRDLKAYNPDFQRGYNVIKREGLWSRFNDKLTNWAASLGSSLKK